MSERPGEETRLHTRLLKCALEVEDARAYWANFDPETPDSARSAFEAYWFGARSMDRIKVLLTNFHARFATFPEAFTVLRRWEGMTPDARALICHWHLQLSDPLYRRFTGQLLVERRDRGAGITRDRVVAFVGEQGEARWTMSTRIQFASKLLSSAYSAGLVGGRRDPRPLVFPRVSDEALTYLLYMLRGVVFEGSILENVYLRSVGLEGVVLEDRLRGLSGVSFRRQGGLVDLEWRHDGLIGWAEDTLALREGAAA